MGKIRAFDFILYGRIQCGRLLTKKTAFSVFPTTISNASFGFQKHGINLVKGIPLSNHPMFSQPCRNRLNIVVKGENAGC